MIELILKASQTFGMLCDGDNVTVALSGGADSVALLHALVSLKDELKINVNAAHLNHGIRGAEADRDEAFVKALCEKLGVTLFCEKLDVPSYAKSNHLSLELAARELRYDFLRRVATGKIATAHTASDNLETLIFNLTRGTALKGLCGIPPIRDNIIRPIILCSRSDVENYCKQNNLSFVTDSTNLSDEYSRNKIRHNVIPVLKEINSNVEYAAVRTAHTLSEDNFHLENTAKKIMFTLLDDDSLAVDGFCDLSASIAKRVIKSYFEVCYPDITLENRHINAIFEACAKNGGKVNLPECIYASVKEGRLSFFTDEEATLKNFKVNITEKINVNNLFSNNLLDCDKIVGKLTIRTRAEGDTIRLYNRGCTKTLKKLYCENKIPLEIRESLPVISDDNGVVWVHSIGVASRCAVSKNTKRVYEIKVSD